MRVKKFEAKSMKEALTMVKQELGPDAVILSARDNRRSFGIGGEASVEITAAVSEGTLQKKRFTESRMTAVDRQKFQNSDARTQRKVIDKMVDRRMERNHEVERAAQPKRPMTSTSYIDIDDEDVEPSPRRSAALERTSGRRVSQVLNEFNQDFSAPVRKPAPKQAPEENGLADRAMARIRSAARDAWKNNPFSEEVEETQAKPSARINSTYGRDAAPAQPRPAQAPTRAALEARGITPPREPARHRADEALDVVPEDGFVAATTLPPQRSTATAQQQNAQQVAQAATQSREVLALKGEIQRLQGMLEGFKKVPQTFATLHPGADYGIPYDLSFMFQKLTEAGISVDNSVEILKQAESEIDQINIKKRPIVDAWIARWLLTNVRVNTTPFQGRLHLFVGGSGSGKTSSLVKMAAHLVVKEKKRVAILSTDSTKVGAIDQMKIYCQILNVPFAVIRSRSDWEWVLSQLRGVDHILVDFPGLQLRDLDEIQYLKSLLPPEGAAPVTHLCVSATTKDSDADEMTRRYKVTDPSDLVFTNVDQSVQHGIIVNLQKRTGLPLHSFGIGARIPEDFEVATKERVLDLIFKLTKLRKDIA